ncbi:hypothetical protein MMC09_003483 [Bachmanniomyces sp. S44760]|nr:hypothetical protein [Bachmanniomyces sp. S44760]
MSSLRPLARSTRNLTSRTTSSPSILPRSLIPESSAASIPTSPFALPQPRIRASSQSLFSTTSKSSVAHDAEGQSHESHYDPPTGWLFGVPPGEKYKGEGWEVVWFVGFFGSLGLAAVAYGFKEDSSIQTWALEEARRRLEKEGILPDPEFPEKAK